MLAFNFSVPVKMRDGTVLSTIVGLPDSPSPYSVVLIRTPYSSKGMAPAVRAIASHLDLAWVIQDTRGRYDSEGNFRVFNEKEDTLDTIAWIKRQKWYNGEIHIFGPSYLGYTGLQILGEKDVDIKTLFAPMTFIKPEDGLVYRDEVLHLHWALPWSIMTSTRVQSSLNLINGKWPDVFGNSLSNLVTQLGWPNHIWDLFLNPSDHSVWKKFDVSSTEPLKTRVCLIGGWFDFMLKSTFSTYNHLIKRGGTKPDLILGPWSHNGYLQSAKGIGSFEIGDEGKSNVLTDFTTTLERARTHSPQLIKAFIMRANYWVELASWPPQQVKQKKFYLGDKETLNDKPSQKPIELAFKVSPSNPVPTLGGCVWEFEDPVLPEPKDQRSLKNRKDILRFYTPPFEATFTLLGLIYTDLWIKTEVPETHFTAKLVFVETDGFERIIQDGITRVMGIQENFKLIRIEVRKGEKIGLEISWSNFPKFACPPLTQPSIQSLFMSIEMPSSLTLSFMEESDAYSQ